MCQLLRSPPRTEHGGGAVSLEELDALSEINIELMEICNKITDVSDTISGLVHLTVVRCASDVCRAVLLQDQLFNLLESHVQPVLVSCCLSSMDDYFLTHGTPDRHDTYLRNFNFLAVGFESLACNIIIARHQGRYPDILVSLQQIRRLICRLQVCCFGSYNLIFGTAGQHLPSILNAIRTICESQTREIFRATHELLWDIHRLYVVSIYGERFSLIRFLWKNLDSCDLGKYNEAIKSLNFINNCIETGKFIRIREVSAEEAKKAHDEFELLSNANWPLYETSPQVALFKNICISIPHYHCILCNLFQQCVRAIGDFVPVRLSGSLDGLENSGIEAPNGKN